MSHDHTVFVLDAVRRPPHVGVFEGRLVTTFNNYCGNSTRLNAQLTLLFLTG